MPTFNEELLDALIRHQIGLLRFSGSVRNKIWALLDETEVDIRRQIERAGRIGLDSPVRIRNLNKLLAGIRKTRLTAWSQANASFFEDMRDLARSEPGFVDRIMAATFPVELGMVLPDAAVLRNIVTATPFLGKTLKEHVAKLRVDDVARMEAQVKIGLVQGEDLPEIARRLVGTARLRGRDGVFNITRRHAATIARTATSGIGAAARRAFWEANADIAPEWVFIATLDSRTTPICRRFDGKLFEVGKGPILPLHMGERSVEGPVIDGEVIGQRPVRNFTNRSLLREFAESRGIKAPTTRGKLPHGTRGAFDDFARRRMRELTGTTPAKTTYGPFLRRQSAAVQDDILGPTRGALFRRGGLDIEQFVLFNGRELTLAELASQHADAFLRANIDPAMFL